MTTRVKRVKVFSYPVVNIAVGEHRVEVCYALHRLPVVLVLKPLVDSAEIHGIFDDGVIILWK